MKLYKVNYNNKIGKYNRSTKDFYKQTLSPITPEADSRLEQKEQADSFFYGNKIRSR